MKYDIATVIYLHSSQIHLMHHALILYLKPMFSPHSFLSFIVWLFCSSSSLSADILAASSSRRNWWSSSNSSLICVSVRRAWVWKEAVNLMKYEGLCEDPVHNLRRVCYSDLYMICSPIQIQLKPFKDVQFLLQGLQCSLELLLKQISISVRNKARYKVHTGVPMCSCLSEWGSRSHI